MSVAVRRAVTGDRVMMSWETSNVTVNSVTPEIYVKLVSKKKRLNDKIVKHLIHMPTSVYKPYQFTFVFNTFTTIKSIFVS